MRYDNNDPELEILKRFSGGFAGKRVLEVGCGNGRITQKLAPLIGHLDAIDPNEEKIEKAIALNESDVVHFHSSGLEQFSAKENYDVIILSWSL